MKTFETEKHNIPEGATHYENETLISHFAWFELSGDDLLCMPITTPPYVWLPCSLEFCKDSITPIPQTSIETPEERDVEWVSGNIAIYEGKQALIIACHPNHPSVVIEMPDNEYLNVLASELSKQETEAERVERERDEFKVEMCKDLGIDAVGCNTACIINKLYELGYIKESE